MLKNSLLTLDERNFGIEIKKQNQHGDDDAGSRQRRLNLCLLCRESESVCAGERERVRGINDIA